jgi:hypothetical protein
VARGNDVPWFSVCFERLARGTAQSRRFVGTNLREHDQVGMYARSVSSPLRPVLAVVGAVVYAVAGGLMGAENAGWLSFAQNANALLPFLGIGAALVIVAARGTSFHQQLRIDAVGRVAGYLLAVGAVLYVVSWLIQFAIFGTLTVALGLICLAFTFWARRLGQVIDRVLVTLSAIGSLTWNTETTSALLLVAVGLIWAVLAVRLFTPESLGGGSGVPAST